MLTSQDNLLARVEQLERQNRRMKLIGLGSLVVAASILLMGQAKQTPLLNEVKAKSFTLMDSNGRTRARLFMSSRAVPIFALYDSAENPRVVMDASLGPGLTIFDANRNVRMNLDVSPSNGPELLLSDETKQGNEMLFNVSSDGPSVALDDVNGFETDIGVSNLVSPTTGETSKTSAASIKLFGKDKKVLWSAP